MNRETFRTVDWRRLADLGASSATVVKLMMACNDMQTADEALEEWRKEQPRWRRDRAVRAKMYFVRLQISHLFEALKVIEDVRGDDDLMRLVRASDRRTQESFNALLPYVKGGAQRAWVERHMGQVRSNLVFHYDESGKLIGRALDKKGADPNQRPSTITRASTAHQWHFKPGDDLLESIVAHQIWRIDPTADLNAEVDKVLVGIKSVLLHFTDFCGEFIWNYGRRN